ncbi:hypothetical protein KC866_03365 [Patescibacteria group bacterium]|nr:hypothetical protein [Patescibacteria group bacterium]
MEHIIIAGDSFLNKNPMNGIFVLNIRDSVTLMDIFSNEFSKHLIRSTPPVLLASASLRAHLFSNPTASRSYKTKTTHAHCFCVLADHVG